MTDFVVPARLNRICAPLLGAADHFVDGTETEFGHDGQLAKLHQSNWQVDFTQYREGGGQLLPRRLTAVNEDVKVRLVIDNWVFR